MNSFDFCLSASHNRYQVNDPVKVNVGFVPFVIAGMITKAFYPYLFTTALLLHNSRMDLIKDTYIIKGGVLSKQTDIGQSEFFFLEDRVVFIQSANHIQVVNNKVTCNVNKKTEKLVSLLLLTTIFSGVVNRRACLRDVTITNFYMADWAVLAVKAACNHFPF